jgi:hypothetical protein
MTAWAVALIVYGWAAGASLIPFLKAALEGVKLNPGGPAFDESPHFSPEIKDRLKQNYERMRGTLSFWKQQAKKYERLHLYCMLWTIFLSAVTPVLTILAPQYPDDPYARWFLTTSVVHLSLIAGLHKFFKAEINFKAFRQGESEFYDVYRRLLDDPGSFGGSEEDQITKYFSEVSLIRKQVRNAETDTYAGLDELRQAQARSAEAVSQSPKS